MKKRGGSININRERKKERERVENPIFRSKVKETGFFLPPTFQGFRTL